MADICTHEHISAQPLLRWAGSKKRQFNVLSSYFPDCFATYVEPFAGSASFLFRMGPQNAKINDINFDLYDFYRYAQTSPKELYASFLRIPRTPDAYYTVRAKFNLAERSLKRAVYFYFLNRNCFNGIYRVNQSGAFNVPFSDDRVSPYLTTDEFDQSCQTLNRAQIHCADFEKFCRECVLAGDFVYLDPPYYRDGTRIFNEYGTSTFATSDFQRLGKLLNDLNRIGAKFLLSFPRTRESITLAKQWHSAIRYVRRTIAGDLNARRKQAEMLIFNYDKRPT